MASIRNSVVGAPMVVGLTPFTLLGPVGSPEGIASALDYPPTIDADRMNAYADFEALVENRPWAVFDDLNLKGDQETKIVLALALPELLCNVWADAVWNDPPALKMANDKADGRWQQFARENDLDARGWESVFSAAMRGTSVLKLRVDEDDPFEQVRLEEVSAGVFFPKLKRGSDRAWDYIVLAWEEDRSDTGRKPELWQVRELHLIEGGRYVVRHQARKRGSTAWLQAAPDERTELDFLPFVDLHGARWSGRYWGMSELQRATTLFDELDNRLSDIAEVLEYHGKPVLQVPASLMPGGVLEKGADRTIGIRDPALADVARYITYDAMIDSQISALDKIIELVLLTCEVPSTYFGMGAEGAATSGVALKLRLQNYLKKASRWQRRETLRLRTLAEFVLRIDGFSAEDARASEVTHGSPLPADDEQEARIESLLVGGVPLSSRKTSIERLRRVPDADEELKAIDDEAQAASVGAPTLPVATGLTEAGITLADATPQEDTLTPPVPPVA